ncbi:tubulin-binding prefolding complex subunit [Saccharomycopsis crataegensis]|uniref:Tubulin-binding prefolding complex subunit n=1 Tax=Saccharomycopsis crataegensis TaxID=43959 RepID=A0AAV5QTJ5_9ASCO|nr:tubulin-binding prefolding complex subunit [Saccharomycopsis crataegensis]
MSSDTKTSGLSKEEKQRKFQQQYNDFQETINQLTEKINQLRGDYDEHTIVLDTLKKAPKDRNCYRMVGGVLISNTAEEAAQILETKAKNIVTALDNLSKELVKTHKEFEKWKKDTGVKIVRTD